MGALSGLREAYEPAAWLHDWLYAHAEAVLVVGAGGELRPINRGEADALLREASEALGFRGSGAATMYAGVRVGGWLAWRRYRRRAAAAQALALAR